jgi:PEP-CTERM motif
VRLRSLLLSALILVLPLSLLADTVYTYTGNSFTSYYGSPSPFTAADFVSGSLTVATRLGDNLSDQAISPTSFSFSNGIDTLTNTDPNVNDAVFHVSTDAAGAIDKWIVYIQTDTLVVSSRLFGTVEDYGVAGEASIPGGSIVEEGLVLNDAGTWSSNAPLMDPPSAVPEPSSLFLLGTGTIGVAGMMRSRLAMVSAAIAR